MQQQPQQQVQNSQIGNGGRSNGQQQVVTMAREYANVNSMMPKEYWDYENASIQWGYYPFYRSLTYFYVYCVYISVHGST
jgi:hypothetical protein